MTSHLNILGVARSLHGLTQALKPLAEASRDIDFSKFVDVSSAEDGTFRLHSKTPVKAAWIPIPVWTAQEEIDQGGSHTLVLLAQSVSERLSAIALPLSNELSQISINSPDVDALNHGLVEARPLLKETYEIVVGVRELISGMVSTYEAYGHKRTAAALQEQLALATRVESACWTLHTDVQSHVFVGASRVLESRNDERLQRLLDSESGLFSSEALRICRDLRILDAYDLSSVYGVDDLIVETQFLPNRTK